jgi:hypothetical protein
MGDLVELNNERWTQAYDHNGDLQVHVSSHGRIKFRFHDDTKYVLSMVSGIDLLQSVLRTLAKHFGTDDPPTPPADQQFLKGR